MSARRAARIGITVAALAIGAAACQLVAGLDGDFTQAPPPHDGGAEAAAEAGPSACMSATYPDPPSGADDGASNEIVLALRSIDMGEGTVVPPGYDLDHVCTCFADAGPSCTSDKPHCDAPGGVDNASAQFFNLVQFAVGASTFSSATISARADQGIWSFLLRIRGYNGKADDPHVEVAFFPSPGLPNQMTPLWNGTDEWPVTSQAVMNGDLEQPAYVADGAYVAGGVLVAAAPSVLLRLGSEEDTIGVQLTGGVITGTLAKGPSGWALTEGVLAGRWPIGNVFQALGSYRDGDGNPLCTDVGLVYSSVKSAICNGLDILGDPTAAKNQPCDALSIGIGFTAQEGKIGAVDPPAMSTPGCPPETDPTNDSCH